jgi:hypothetical protein
MPHRFRLLVVDTAKLGCGERGPVLRSERFEAAIRRSTQGWNRERGAQEDLAATPCYRFA